MGPVARRAPTAVRGRRQGDDPWGECEGEESIPTWGEDDIPMADAPKEEGPDECISEVEGIEEYEDLEELDELEDLEEYEE